MRCVIVVNPYMLDPEDPALLKQYAFLSCAKICVDDSRFSPDLHKDKRVTLNKKQKSEISDSTGYGRTIMFVVTPATEARGLQWTDDSVTRLKNEFAANDPHVSFSHVPFSDDDTDRPAEVCSLEMFFLQNMAVSDKVIIIADTRYTQRWSECKINPTLCKGDLAFFCNCPTTLENSRLWAHERTPGIPRNVDDQETGEFADVLGSIAEDQQLTRCAHVCLTGTEEDQAERYDQGTIDEVLRNQDMEGGDALEEADREAELLEQMPLPGH